MSQAPAPSSGGVAPELAKSIEGILRSMGVDSHDPRVTQQLMDFVFRYVTDIFQESAVFSEHASRSEISLEDVRLAIQGRVHQSFASKPSNDLLMELAKKRNEQPFPIAEREGVILPEAALLKPNYQIKRQ